LDGWVTSVPDPEGRTADSLTQLRANSTTPETSFMYVSRR
jgi:hypothetical protein